MSSLSSLLCEVVGVSLSPQARPGVPPHHGSAETSVPHRAEVLQLLPLPQVGGDHGGREAAGEPSIYITGLLVVKMIGNLSENNA